MRRNRLENYISNENQTKIDWYFIRRYGNLEDVFWSVFSVQGEILPKLFQVYL